MTQSTSKARETILASIREHLAASAEHDHRVGIDHSSAAVTQSNGAALVALSRIDLFKTSLEAVNGHCVVARTELEIVQALTRIITELKHSQLNPRRIALSDAKPLEHLIGLVAVQMDVTIAPSSSDLFDIDIEHTGDLPDLGKEFPPARRLRSQVEHGVSFRRGGKDGRPPGWWRDTTARPARGGRACAAGSAGQATSAGRPGRVRPARGRRAHR